MENVRVSRIRPGTVRLYRCPVDLPEEPSQPRPFLAERYLSASAAEVLASLVDRDQAAARAMSIRHIQTIYVPADETCFTLFEAPSLEMVSETSGRFGLGYRRVVAAIVIRSPQQESQ
jgi:hypothetical protein